MRRLVWLATALLVGGLHCGLPTSLSSPQAAWAAHPAVVRVISTTKTGASLGSGALVAVNAQHGLVLTNWHVVRDADGPILVAFPDGFRAAATVLKTDRDWDLAGLAIQRPAAQPIPLATQPPQPGEPLTIAGYGGGSYREVTGRCTQYVSPGGNNPREMVELAAGARFGDSGGPIFNQRGELAGVLFGTAFGQTTGSYCGRVRHFLTSVAEDFQKLQPHPALIARLPPVGPASATPAGNSPAESIRNASQVPPAILPEYLLTGNPAIVPPTQDPVVPRAPVGGAMPSTGTDLPAAAIAASTGMDNPAGSARAGSSESVFDQLRNFLAVVGACAILFHGLRVLSGSQQPSP